MTKSLAIEKICILHTIHYTMIKPNCIFMHFNCMACLFIKKTSKVSISVALGSVSCANPHLLPPYPPEKPSFWGRNSLLYYRSFARRSQIYFLSPFSFIYLFFFVIYIEYYHTILPVV